MVMKEGMLVNAKRMITNLQRHECRIHIGEHLALLWLYVGGSIHKGSTKLRRSKSVTSTASVNPSWYVKLLQANRRQHWKFCTGSIRPGRILIADAWRPARRRVRAESADTQLM